MTRDEIIERMNWDPALVKEGDSLISKIERIVRAAEQAEREAIERMCREADKSTHPADLADAIRARGEK